MMLTHPDAQFAALAAERALALARADRLGPLLAGAGSQPPPPGTRARAGAVCRRVVALLVAGNPPTPAFGRRPAPGL